MFNKLAMALLATAIMAAPSVYAEMKIVVLDPARAIAGSDEGKALIANLESEMKADRDKIVASVEAFQALQANLQKDAEVMSDAEKRRIQQQIESRNNDFVYLRQKLQRQIEERQQELFAGIDGKVQKAIEELVKSEDYDLILPRQAALYVNEIYNITRKVTEKLNELDSPR